MKWNYKKERYIHFNYEGTKIYVGNKNTLALQTKDMIFPFETGKREAEESLSYCEKGKTLYDVPCEYVLECIKKANEIFEKSNK